MRISEEKKAALSAAVCVFLAGLFLAAAGGFLDANPYNSYALQAARWLEGHLDLAENYAHLEIASYGGRYFISFPPFSEVMLSQSSVNICTVSPWR